MVAPASRTLAALRQMATLGLPGRSVVPEVIGLMNRLAGFELWGLRFMDAHFRLVDGFASPEIPITLVQDFAQNFHNREAGGGRGMTASTAVQSGQKVILTSRLMDRRTLEKTEFYERIARPVNMDMPAQMPLLLGGKHPFAVLVMGRTLGAPEFSAATIGLLEEAHPWLCHLLGKADANPTLPDHELAVSGDSGVLVLDPAGRIESASPGAVSLLLWAADMGLTNSSLRHAVAGDVGHLLKRMARSVGLNLHGGDAPVPAMNLRNRYGSFSLRAYALGALVSGMPARVSLHIERRMPLLQRLFSAPRFLALPNREREVALCLARGRSHTETAAELGVKPSSVIDAIRSLYHRLDIDSRDRLVPALLAAA